MTCKGNATYRERQKILNNLSDDYGASLVAVEKLALDTVREKARPVFYMLNIENDKDKGKACKLLKKIDQHKLHISFEEELLLLAAFTDYVACKFEELHLDGDPYEYIQKAQKYSPATLSFNLALKWKASFQNAKWNNVTIRTVRSALNILERSLPPFDSHNLAKELREATEEGRRAIEDIEARARRATRTATKKAKKIHKWQEAVERKREGTEKQATDSVNTVHFQRSSVCGLLTAKDRPLKTGLSQSRSDMSNPMANWWDDSLSYSVGTNDLSLSTESGLCTASSEPSKSLSSIPRSVFEWHPTTRSSTAPKPKSVNGTESDALMPDLESKKENLPKQRDSCAELLPCMGQDPYKTSVSEYSPLGGAVALNPSHPLASSRDANRSLQLKADIQHPLGKSGQVSLPKRSCPWGSHTADGKKNAFSLLMASSGGKAKQPKKF